jgi:hypothetical protein
MVAGAIVALVLILGGLGVGIYYLLKWLF